MRFHTTLIALVAGLGLVLAGCNKPAADPATDTIGTAATAVTAKVATDELTVTTDGSLPTGFPQAVLKPLPEATIDRAGTGSDGSLLEMTTKLPVDKVTDFYVQHLVDRGWQIGEPQTAGDSRMQDFTFETNTISLTTLARAGGNLVSLVLTTSAAETAEDMPDELAAPDVVSLPEGFPSDILPRYPDSRLDRAELTEKEAIFEQRSGDTPTQILKFYEDHFKSLGMEITKDLTVEATRYIAFAYSNGDPGGIGATFNSGSNGKTILTISYEFNWVPKEK